TFQYFWGKTWGPRMGEYFQEIVKAMAVVNVDIAYERGRPEDQYTLLDVVPVLQQPKAAERLFNLLQPQKSLDHKQLRDFYENDFLALRTEDRRDFREVVLPISYKMNLLAEYRGMRATLGQPVSSVDFGRVVRERKLLFVNCNAGQIGADNAQMMGALIINAVAAAIAEQAALEDAAARSRVTFVIA